MENTLADGVTGKPVRKLHPAVSVIATVFTDARMRSAL